MSSRLILVPALAVGLLAGCTDAPASSTAPDAAEGTAGSSGPTPSASGASASEADDDPGTQTVQVYFSRIEGTSSCSVVEAVPREVPETEAVATAALEELFQGPTEAEKGVGLSSSFSAETQDLLRHVHVADGTAYLDLDRALLDIDEASASCGGSALMASIEATLEQFPTVDDVRYAVEGEPRTFYDFVQIGCPTPGAAGDRCDPEPFRR
jgi:spore germination protein GerM